MEANSLIRSSKMWSKISEDDYFWKLKVEHDYGSAALKNDEKKPWKTIYKYHNLGTWGPFVKTNIESRGSTLGLYLLGIVMGNEGNIWGRSDNFRLRKQEHEVIMSVFNTYSRTITSMKIAGESYVILRSNFDMIHLKKGPKCCTISKSSKGYILACSSNDGLVQVSILIGKIGEYLQSLGY